jgi:hypothetical protein
MNTFRIEGTIKTEWEESKWWDMFDKWLNGDIFIKDNEELPLFPKGEDLIELSKDETNFEVM